MFRQVYSYIRYLFLSGNEHSVHSPFVFQFVTLCLYDNTKKPAYSLYKKIVQSIFQNKKTITVTDFGVGSKVFTSDQRIVSDIAKNAGISKKRAHLLIRIIHYFEPKTILEIGTSVGLATSAMRLGCESSLITTVEGCPETMAVAKHVFQKFKFKNITAVNSAFEKYLSGITSETNFDLIYFDGNHSKEATLTYFNQLLPTINNQSIWIFDDIHWSISMEEAWEEIIQNPIVKVSIDTYQWGILFFRSEQEKEHFIIRL